MFFLAIRANGLRLLESCQFFWFLLLSNRIYRLGGWPICAFDFPVGCFFYGIASIMGDFQSLA